MINNINFLQTLAYQRNKQENFIPIDAMLLIIQYTLVEEMIANAARLVKLLQGFPALQTSEKWSATERNSVALLKTLTTHNRETVFNLYRLHFHSLILFFADTPNFALHCAVFNNSLPIVQALLAQPNVNLNAMNKGKTALSLAVESAHVSLNIVQALLAQPDINPNIANSLNFTPIEHAANDCIYMKIPALLAHKDTHVSTKLLKSVEAKGYYHVSNILKAHSFYSAAMKADPTQLNALLNAHNQPDIHDIYKHLFLLVEALPDTNAKHFKLSSAIEVTADGTAAHAMSLLMHQWQFGLQTRASRILKAIDQLAIDTLPLRDVGKHTTRLYLPSEAKNQLSVHRIPLRPAASSMTLL